MWMWAGGVQDFEDTEGHGGGHCIVALGGDGGVGSSSLGDVGELGGILAANLVACG